MPNMTSSLAFVHDSQEVRSPPRVVQQPIIQSSAFTFGAGCEGCNAKTINTTAAGIMRGTIPQRSGGRLGQMRRPRDYGANGITTEQRSNRGSTEKTTDCVREDRGSTGRPAPQADSTDNSDRGNEHP